MFIMKLYIYFGLYVPPKMSSRIPGGPLEGLSPRRGERA
jgi:hypothetical protein